MTAVRLSRSAIAARDTLLVSLALVSVVATSAVFTFALLEVLQGLL
jgi:hypothetical protein